MWSWTAAPGGDYYNATRDYWVGVCSAAVSLERDDALLARAMLWVPCARSAAHDQRDGAGSWMHAPLRREEGVCRSKRPPLKPS